MDVRELEGRPTGVGRVIQGLLGAWPVDELALISQRRIGLPPELVARGRIEQVVVEKAASLPGALWEHLVLPGVVRDTNSDALLAPNYSMPIGARIPTAVCMHDCAPFALRDEFSAREGFRRRWNARHAARNASFLFMGTDFAATEAVRYLGCAPDACLVAPWGLTSGFAEVPPGAVEDVKQQYGVDANTILFVGSGFGRRDLPSLVRRVERVAAERPSATLAVAGRGHDRAAHSPFVTPLGFVPEIRLAALFSAAGLVVYPSAYEGFGLPVLEALASGTRVIATDATALSEVFAGRATLVPHENDDAWVAAINAELGRPAEAETVTWAHAQSWTPTAAAVRQRLLEAVEGNS